MCIFQHHGASPCWKYQLWLIIYIPDCFVVWNHGFLWLSIQLGRIIIPTDEFIFFRGVGIPPTSMCIYIYGIFTNIPKISRCKYSIHGFFRGWMTSVLVLLCSPCSLQQNFPCRLEKAAETEGFKMTLLSLGQSCSWGYGDPHNRKIMKSMWFYSWVLV